MFGIGQVVAEGLAGYFADEHTRDTLHHLLDAGVVAEAPGARRGGRGGRGAAGRQDAGRDRHPARASAGKRRRRRSAPPAGMPLDR